jgi:thiol-disulfide isomerase/thioredoxin
MSSERSILSLIFSWTFFGGLFVGLLLGIAGLIGYARYDMAQADGESTQRVDLDPPDIPEKERTVTYGAVPDDWTLHSATADDSTTFGALNGQTVVINKWATWCVPCRAEMPALDALHDSTGSDVVLAVVSEEPRDRVSGYVEDGDFSVPVYVIDETPAALEGLAIPRTYVVRSDGQVVYRHDGAADWNSEPVYRLLNRYRSSSAS